MRWATINTLFHVIFSGVPCACGEVIHFHSHVSVISVRTCGGCCALNANTKTAQQYIIFALILIISSYLLSSPGIHSSFPAASVAPPGGKAAPPTDLLLAAPACAAAIFLTTQAHSIIYIYLSEVVNTLNRESVSLKRFQYHHRHHSTSRHSF